MQDISEADAEAEGVGPVIPTEAEWWMPDRPRASMYRALWDSINGPRGFGWDTNCYVWVLTFRLTNDAAVARKPPQAGGSEKG